MNDNTIQAKITKLINANPMHLVFIVDAIDKNIKNALRDEQQTIIAFENSIINGEAWVKAAHQINAALWPEQ